MSIDKKDIIIDTAENIYLKDLNNKYYFDTRFGNGIFILGHNNKNINNKIITQINKGTLFGFPNQNEINLIKKLKKTLDWYDEFILCNTGTESIMRAFRIARSYTNKSKIAIFSGFWHGGYDGTQIKNSLEYKTKVSSSGIPKNLLEDTILLSNNEEDIFIQLEKEKKNLSMIFIEPVQQTVPLLKISFLQKLRRFCLENKILLGFDEMITGFRLSIKGAQKYTGVYSDIACYGKAIGLGYPIGIVAINKKLSDHINSISPPVKFGGTFSGNPLSTYAACVFLDEIEDKKNLYTKINNMTFKLCSSFNKYCIKENILIRAYYVGSMYRIIFTDKNINSLEERINLEYSNNMQQIFQNLLLKYNVLTGKNPLSFISYAHTEDNINELIGIYIKVLDEFKQIISNKTEGEYYFTKKFNNTLTYIGNKHSFNDLYKNCDDPWKQSKKFDDTKIKDLYSNIIANNILKDNTILDIGCGTGHSTDFIYKIINPTNLSGCDISIDGINKAKKLFPMYNFFEHDINNKLNQQYDIIILSSMIWYITDNIHICFNNIINALNSNGKIIIHNIFLKEQKYAKDIFYGLDGLIDFINKNFRKQISILETDTNNTGQDKYWGCLVINKI